jgi:integrase
MSVTTLSVQERQAKLEALAAIEVDILATTTVKELRSMVKGVVVNYSSLNKTELLAHIAERTEDIRAARQVALDVAATEAQEVQEKLAQLTAANLSDPTPQGYRAAFGIESHKDMMDAVRNALEAIALDAVNHPNDPLDFMMKVGGEVQKYLLTLSRCYAESTQKSSVTEINDYLEKWVSEMVGDSFATDKKNAVSIFLHQVSKAMKSLSIKLNNEYGGKVHDRIRFTSDLKDINETLVLEKAVQVLEDLADYRDVAIALAILTGRRMGEVMGTLRIVGAGTDTLAVSGLTKAKSDKETALDKVHTIPVLADPALIVRALKYLDDGGYRMDVADDVNPKYGKTFARQMDKWVDVIGEKATYKSMRAFYAAVCFKRIGTPKGQLIQSYLAEILGHTENDLNTANSYMVWNLVD